MYAVSHEIQLGCSVGIAVDYNGTAQAHGKARMFSGEIQPFRISVYLDRRAGFSTGSKNLLQVYF